MANMATMAGTMFPGRSFLFVWRGEIMSSAELAKPKRSWTIGSRAGLPIAIVLGAALIALAILFIFRWEIVSPSPAVTHRLDRWTGKIVFCHVSGNLEMDCPVNDWAPVNPRAKSEGPADRGAVSAAKPTAPGTETLPDAPWAKPAQPQSGPWDDFKPQQSK